jgi:hypothetical protein
MKCKRHCNRPADHTRLSASPAHISSITACAGVAQVARQRLALDMKMPATPPRRPMGKRFLPLCDNT